jgi:trans-2,3-dihydro-3-hydroxyanthranilate isomerase
VKPTRRHFLQLTTSGLAATFAGTSASSQAASSPANPRRFRFVQIDVFTSHRLQGNQLAVFPDARGLSDAEMQDIARETNLEETTFVFPREPAVELERGIKVRIFITEQEIPFGGHPTLGTAMVLRNRLVNRKAATGENAKIDRVSLDLQVGKVPIDFRETTSGEAFGEMTQVDPVFGATHDRSTVAALIGVQPSDISEEWPMQTVSTGLPFVIVPLMRLGTLQSLRPNFEKVRAYFEREKILTDFYYITRDTGDSSVGLRSRGIYSTSEDPATGSASGCTAAWMVRYGVVPADQVVHNLQGVEMKRPSHIFFRAGKQGDKITNVRVGGNAIEVAEGEFSL